jgi:hypothetical protein
MAFQEDGEASLIDMFQDFNLGIFDSEHPATKREASPSEAAEISNRILLKTTFKFKRQAPLQQFIFQKLEQALDQKACHVSEILPLVLCQLVKLANQSPRERSPLGSPVRTVRSASITTSVHTNKNVKYHLKPLFLNALHSIKDADRGKVVYSYEEVTIMLSQYILSKRDTLFDPRNLKLALVENDPLGRAFGSKHFTDSRSTHFSVPSSSPSTKTKTKIS